MLESKEKEKLKKVKTKLEGFRLGVNQMIEKQKEHNNKWEKRFTEHSSDEPYNSSCHHCSDGVDKLISWWETNQDIIVSWDNSPEFRSENLLEIIDDLLLEVNT